MDPLCELQPQRQPYDIEKIESRRITRRPPSDVTALIGAWRQGEEDALARLMEVVQTELHHITAGMFRRRRAGNTVQPAAVVHEVFLRFEAQKRVGTGNRAELFAIAARLMRRVLVDHARRNETARQGHGAVHVELVQDLGFPKHLAPEVVALDHSLLDLERSSQHQSGIAEMRMLAGLTLEEIAKVEEISQIGRASDRERV